MVFKRNRESSFCQRVNTTLEERNSKKEIPTLGGASSEELTLWDFGSGFLAIDEAVHLPPPPTFTTQEYRQADGSECVL